MSTTSVAAMVAQLQQRLPMNLSSSYCGNRLNQAYQWIEQQGAFVWGVGLTTVPMLAGQYWINIGTGFVSNAPSPEAPDSISLTVIDVGKPMSVFQSQTGGFRVMVPFFPPDKLGLYQIFNTTSIPGVFAGWTLIGTADGYQIRFAPSAAAVAVNTNFAIQYHAVPLIYPDSALSFFPTPDQFNSLILDLAEAEIKRVYNLMGWDVAQQKAQASTMLIADQYRSTKMFQPGLGEEQKDASEAQLSRAGG